MVNARPNLGRASSHGHGAPWGTYPLPLRKEIEPLQQEAQETCLAVHTGLQALHVTGTSVCLDLLAGHSCLGSTE